MQHRPLPADGQHPCDGDRVRRGHARNGPCLLGQFVRLFCFGRGRHHQEFALHVKGQTVTLGVHPLLEVGRHALKPDVLQKQAGEPDSVQPVATQELHSVTPNIGRPQIILLNDLKTLFFQHAAGHAEAVVRTGRPGPEKLCQHVLGGRPFKNQVRQQQERFSLRVRSAGKSSQRPEDPGFGVARRTVRGLRHRRWCRTHPKTQRSSFSWPYGHSNRPLLRKGFEIADTRACAGRSELRGTLLRSASWFGERQNGVPCPLWMLMPPQIGPVTSHLSVEAASFRPHGNGTFRPA